MSTTARTDGMMRAVLIPADETKNVQVVSASGPRGLGSLIGADYVERVRCAMTARYSVVLVVDETGAVQSPRKPYNRRADALYSAGRGSGIYGDALVAQEGWVGDGMDFIDMPDPNAVMLLVGAFAG